MDKSKELELTEELYDLLVDSMVKGISREAWVELTSARLSRFADEGRGEAGWISMAERWPDPKQDVLAFLNEHNTYYANSMRVCRFTPFDYGDGKPIPEFSMPGFGGMIATHWMPLPAHPATGKEVLNARK